MSLYSQNKEYKYIMKGGIAMGAPRKGATTKGNKKGATGNKGGAKGAGKKAGNKSSKS